MLQCPDCDGTGEKAVKMVGLKSGEEGGRMENYIEYEPCDFCGGTGGIMKRILICGGRDFDGFAGLYLDMKEERDKAGSFTLVVGYDPERDYPKGADQAAYYSALDLGMKVETFPYKYQRGKKGGPERNQEMIETLPSEVWAYPGPNSKGTWDTVNRASEAGIPVKIRGPYAEGRQA